MCVSECAHPTLVCNAVSSDSRGAHTVVHALFAWVPLIVPTEVGSLATHIFGFTILPMESLLRPLLLQVTTRQNFYCHLAYLWLCSHST